MEYAQKVLWSEGMFLTPHHFQQADRYTESLISRRLSAIRSRHNADADEGGRRGGWHVGDSSRHERFAER